MSNIKVKKRNGKLEELDYDKIHQVVSWATEGLKKVSVSDVEMNAKLQLTDGITTRKIHEVLIQSASDLITPKNSNYQYVASRLLCYYIRKEVFGAVKDLPHLEDVIKTNVEAEVYDKIVLEKYNSDDIDIINDMIKHERDFKFAYAGMQQMVDKYLIKDRNTGQIYETPQYAYIMIAMTLFADYKKGQRLNLIRKFYNDISQFKISLPTPIIAGVRTPNRQYSSCTLIDVGDSLDSIFSSDHAVGSYTAKRAGIGLNFGRIRGIGSKIRGGEVVHTGVIPFLKKFESTTKCCTQNGLRGGSSTTHFPFWHSEIESIIVLKNNRGTDDNRVRHMDYSIQFSRLFYKRFVEDGEISLFSPHDVEGLYEAFGDNDVFDPLYEKYEKDKSIPKKKIKARKFFTDFCRERIETGRMYVMNIDNANTVPFKDKVNQSNLCQEILLPTTPITHIDDGNEEDSEIALCVLGGINCGEIKKLTDLEQICENAVRALDFVIEHQDYPVKSAEKMLKRRSLGVGVVNYAYYLAKNKAYYGSPEALELTDELFEHIQYYLLKASNKLAKEMGACEYFDRTTYSDGILPIDRQNDNAKALTKREYACDWETLREDIKEYGLRNSVLSALMPAESSAVVSNSTNGIEPPRALLSMKQSKQGILKQLVPEVEKLAPYYTLAWDLYTNDDVNNTTAIMQKWIDQAISINHYYNPQHPIKAQDEGEVSLSEVARDLVYGYKLGNRNFYYANTNDGKTDGDDSSCSGGGCTL